MSRLAAIVLAASRPDDPVARLRGTTHKALVPILGVPMVQRVIEALRDSRSIGSIAICVERPEVIDGLPDAVRSGLEIVPAEGTPSRSVLSAARQLGAFPLLVTTADHALLSPAMLDFFCEAGLAGDADIVVGLAPASVILTAQPGTKRTFLRFRDDRYSGCNLFLLKTPASLKAVSFWRQAEMHRKRPWRLIRQFGLLPLLLFATGRLTLDQAMRRAGRILGVRVAAVRMPFAEAAIDVDKPEDLVLVEAILRGDRPRPAR